MTVKTLGIVLNFIRYGETSIIVKIYTEKLGLKSYLVSGIRTKKAQGKLALFQPMTLLDMVVYEKPNVINRIREYQLLSPLTSVPYEMKKSSMALFLSEVLLRVVQEDDQNEDYFHFIQNSIQLLDHMPAGYENFHLQFLLKSGRFLGFASEDGSAFQDWSPSEETTALLTRMLQEPYENKLEASNEDRRTVLDIIQQFYRHHFQLSSGFKTAKVLQEVLN